MIPAKAAFLSDGGRDLLVGDASIKPAQLDGSRTAMLAMHRDRRPWQAFAAPEPIVLAALKSLILGMQKLWSAPIGGDIA
jgi:hypothetical protein